VTIAILPLDNMGPVTTNLLPEPNPAAVYTPIELSAWVSDVDAGGSNIGSVQYEVDGGRWLPMTAMDQVFDSPAEAASATIPPFQAAGVHTVCVRGADSIGNIGAEQCAFLAVYDPNGGFVTGGGWISSPPGAYVPDPILTGQANFGFVSAYKKGQTTPTGTTEFQFRVANVNFHSSTYEWLVVAGARAQFKGVGTINGQGSYGFMLTAIDGALLGGGAADKFRIKIWDKATGAIVYDNQPGAADDSDATTVIGGGSIVVHKAK
jgi:hypothetical protein